MKKRIWIVSALVCVLLVTTILLLNQSAKNKRLFQAVWDSDVQAVSDAIRDGANVNAYHRLFTLFADDNVSRTPLLFACYSGENAEEMAHLLLLAGADPNKATPYLKETPLHIAARMGLYSTAYELIECGADINAIDDTESVLSATLVWLTEQERTGPDSEAHRFFCILIERGATLNCPLDRTILHYAVLYGDQFAVEYLLKNTQVDRNKKDFDGKTALDYAVEMNEEEIVKMLQS